MKIFTRSRQFYLQANKPGLLFREYMRTEIAMDILPARQQVAKLFDLFDELVITADVAKVRQRNEAFVRQAGICANEKEYRWFLKINCGEIGCLAFCSEPEETAQFGADLIAWLFLFDDKIGEGPGVTDPRELRLTLDRCLEVCESGLVGQSMDPFHKSLVTLIDRGRQIAGDGWHRKFSNSFRCYFRGLVGECLARNGLCNLNIEEYQKIRRDSIAGYPVFDLIDLQFGDAIDSDDLTLLRHKTADLLGWINDLCSIDKENFESDPINIASVIAKDFSIPYDYAVDRAIELILKPDWALFKLRQGKILSGQNSPEIKKYAMSLQHWVEATYHWSFSARRYTDIHNDRRI
jgi:hypothetical protein